VLVETFPGTKPRGRVIDQGGIWEWADESAGSTQWTPFDATATAILDTAFATFNAGGGAAASAAGAASASCVVQGGAWAYKINFELMQQTNQSSGTPRAIQVRTCACVQPLYRPECLSHPFSPRAYMCSQRRAKPPSPRRRPKPKPVKPVPLSRQISWNASTPTTACKHGGNMMHKLKGNHGAAARESVEWNMASTQFKNLLGGSATIVSVDVYECPVVERAYLARRSECVERGGLEMRMRANAV